MLARLQGDTGCARLALGHIGRERRVDVIRMAHQIARQHVAVLDRHVGALRQRRHGRMGSVAEQRYALARPLRQRIAIVDPPFEYVLNVVEHTDERFVPAGFGGDQLLWLEGADQDSSTHSPL